MRSADFGDAVALFGELAQVGVVASGFGGLEAQIPAPVTVRVDEDSLGCRNWLC